MAALSDSLRGLLGAKTVKALDQALDIQTVADLLDHYPRRYFRRGELTDLSTLRPDDFVTVMARIKSVRTSTYPDRRTGRRGHRTELVVTDGTGDLLLTFFNQRYLEGKLPVGQLGLFSGQVGTFKGKPQLIHPEFEVLARTVDDAAADQAAVGFADRLIPIYPAVSKLASPVIARAVEAVLPQVDPIPDPVPGDVLRRSNLVDLDTALRELHLPSDQGSLDRARRRLVFDEALGLQLLLAQRRQRTSELHTAARPPVGDALLAEFDGAMELTLTSGQQRVGQQISTALAGSQPMHLLLQGDVGTGKTLVALRAMLQVVDAGGQAVLLAPTEVLAHQHHANIVRLLGPLAEGGLLGGAEHATRVTLLTGSTPAAARRRTLLDIASGEAGIVVGTHALLQDQVQYRDLGLIVVDEQHRFGVEQRSALLERIPGQRPHLLVMTATPIPRTVAMTVFGDLDVVMLTERPTGDPQINTHVVSETSQPTHLDRAWERVAEEVGAGHPVFVVCTRISDDSEEWDGDEGADVDDGGDGDVSEVPPYAVETLAAELAAGPLSEVRVGVMHGRLSTDEKSQVMRAFAAGPEDPSGLDVLVSTTVIEVGVDVPDASMMVIMDAERFGVSQLHQLRGRVGRSGQSALCLLVTRLPVGEPGYERLSQVSATLDGFVLAQLDLQLRREGDVLGSSQSGRRSSLRLLSVLRDEEVIASARQAAVDLVTSDPQLENHPALAAWTASLQEQTAAEYLDKT